MPPKRSAQKTTVKPSKRRRPTDTSVPVDPSAQNPPTVDPPVTNPASGQALGPASTQAPIQDPGQAPIQRPANPTNVPATRRRRRAHASADPADGSAPAPGNALTNASASPTLQELQDRIAHRDATIAALRAQLQTLQTQNTNLEQNILRLGRQAPPVVAASSGPNPASVGPRPAYISGHGRLGGCPCVSCIRLIIRHGWAAYEAFGRCNGGPTKCGRCGAAHQNKANALKHPRVCEPVSSPFGSLQSPILTFWLSCIRPYGLLLAISFAPTRRLIVPASEPVERILPLSGSAVVAW